MVLPNSNEAPVDHFAAAEDQGPLQAATSAALDDARDQIHEDEVACVELDEIEAQAVRDKARKSKGD